MPRELHQEVAFTAKREKKTKAAVIREALGMGLIKKRPKKNAGSVLLEIAKMAEKLKTKGPSNLSTNIDKYLYNND